MAEIGSESENKLDLFQKAGIYCKVKKSNLTELQIKTKLNWFIDNYSFDDLPDAYFEFLYEQGSSAPIISHLSLTAAGHKAIGSTPPEYFRENPEKREVDFMTTADILKYCEDIKNDYDKYSKPWNRTNIHIRNYWGLLKRDTPVELEYLNSIGRLPKEFSFDKLPQIFPKLYPQQK